MSYESEKRKQIQIEIDWIKDRLKNKMSEKQRKEYGHQIKKKEYDLDLGVFKLGNNEIK
jgi:hypothetical protein